MLAKTSSFNFAIRRIALALKCNEKYEKLKFVFLTDNINPSPPKSVVKSFKKYNSLQIPCVLNSQMKSL